MSYSPVTETPPQPSHPQNTWSPTDPMDPTDPTDPTDPMDPTDPTDPTDPMDPTDPIDPIDSMDPTDQIDLGPLDFIPLGEGRAYTLGGKTIAVFRQRDGRLFATDNACPHKAGPLADGLVGSGKVICPLHMWKIDLETGRCLGEAGAVRTYPVRAANGRIRITL